MFNVGSRVWMARVGAGAVAAVISASALAGCSDHATVLDEQAESAPLGTAGLQLELDSGLTFRQVGLSLKYPDGRTISQSIDVSAEDATLSAFLGELPVGVGYEVTLSATSTSGVPCAGTSVFDVESGKTVTVMMRLQCGGGTANPDVGAARIKGEIVPAEGECPSVIDRVVVSPSRAGIGVPITIEVVPTAGPPPSVSYAADDGAVAGTGTRATFRCTSAGEVSVSIEAMRAGCVHRTEAIVKCFDDGTPYVPPANGGAGGGGAGGGGPGGGGPGGGGPGGGGPGGGGAGGGGMGGGGMNGGNACQTCTANNCSAQLDACQSEPTAAACQDNRTCANVGGPMSCAVTSSLSCYCGTVPTATCIAMGGNGSCADVITRTSGCLDGRPAGDVPLCVSEHFLDIAYGLGDAYQLVACQRRNCPTQCGLAR